MAKHLTKIKQNLTVGFEVQKLGLNDLFGPKKRRFVWTENLAQFKMGSKAVLYDMSDVLEIRDRINTENFMKLKKKSKVPDEERCFSIIMKKRSIDIICPNLAIKEKFYDSVKTLFEMKRKYNINFNNLSVSNLENSQVLSLSNLNN